MLPRSIFSKVRSVAIPIVRRCQSSLESEVRRFDPDVAVESAVTPPSSWFTEQRFYDMDLVRMNDYLSQIVYDVCYII